MNTQPVITVTAITTAVSWLLGALVVWGLDVSKERQDTIVAGIGILWPLATAAWAYRKVYAPSTVKALVSDAHAAGLTGQRAPKV